MVPTAYLFDPVYMDHDTGWGHPERPERLVAIDQKLRQQPYYKSLIKVEPKIGAKRYIELVHSPSKPHLGSPCPRLFLQCKLIRTGLIC